VGRIPQVRRAKCGVLDHIVLAVACEGHAGQVAHSSQQAPSEGSHDGPDKRGKAADVRSDDDIR
jgi:hypothetical protein